MAWERSTRRATLPPDWQRRREAVLRRDGYVCTHVDQDGVRCTHTATDVDHAVHRDDHRHESLTSLCGQHHKAKTAREAAAGRREAQARRPSRTRPERRHPGEL